jgi:hypothetical protein
MGRGAVGDRTLCVHSTAHFCVSLMSPGVAACSTGLLAGATTFSLTSHGDDTQRLARWPPDSEVLNGWGFGSRADVDEGMTVLKLTLSPAQFRHYHRLTDATTQAPGCRLFEQTW